MHGLSMHGLRKRHIAVATALAAAGCAETGLRSPDVRSEAAVAEALPADVDLASFDQAGLYSGWRAESLLGATVYGAGGEEVGTVENIVVGPDGMIEAVIVEAGGFADVGDTHFRVPWGEVELGRGLESVTVPVTAENFEDYGVFRGVRAGEERRAFRATELLDDYVNLADTEGYGMVDDLIFSRDGELRAVVVRPDIGYGTLRGLDYDIGQPYAYPYFGYDYGFNPGLQSYELPYAQAEILDYEPFDYDLIDPGL